MAFDTTTRKRLSDFVADARRVLTEEFAEQLQSLYGISVTGDIAPLERLTHLDAEGLELAATLRQRIVYLTSASPEARDATKAAVDRLKREQAFTVLNRLAAIRMAEKRGLIVESVGQQYQSKGFKVFESVAGSAIGETYDRYRCYLFCLFDELAIDLGALFDRRSPQALLFPRERPLLALLDLLNETDLQDLWAEDETIGWIYQYYNDPAERKKMREESAAPRNSRELAVRNQFFTPRYVVEFLTDNTLGRIWYEMTKGVTALKEQCRYLVRRPTEIFLKPGETAPNQPKQDGLSQEDILKQPVFIPHRPLKDPRSILMLDPACGSMHFGLYAFDLFEAIYEEAWDIATGSDEAAKSGEFFAPFCVFVASFPDKAAFQRQVPRMIVEHNLHGIDIDPRAAQIAGLSLWLRAQRAWNAAGVKPVDRPRITRSNIVCAEPMPGDKVILAEFVEQQFPEGERSVFGFLLETVFDRMTLAGEAGSLLKIEVAIRTAIAKAKKLWEKEPQQTQRMLFATGEDKRGDTQKKLDLSGITDEQFWEGAEDRIYAALREYAEQADAGGFQRRLFAEDAARGFAFIDVCRKRYDVILMNPPFGEATETIKAYLDQAFPLGRRDLYACFVENCSANLVTPLGRVGVLSSRQGFYLPSQEEWRRTMGSLLLCCADLGHGVLDDALVETAAYVVSCTADSSENFQLFFDMLRSADKGEDLLQAISRGGENVYCASGRCFHQLPGAQIAYWAPASILSMFQKFHNLEPELAVARNGMVTCDDFRFVRLIWEVGGGCIGRSHTWCWFAKGGEYAPYLDPVHLSVKWNGDGRELMALGESVGNAARARQSSSFYFKSGLTYPARTTSGFSPRVLPEGVIFSHMGMSIFCNEGVDPLFVLGILLSPVAKAVLEMFVGVGDAVESGSAARRYSTGVISTLPVPTLRHEEQAVIAGKTGLICNLVLANSQSDETCPYFTATYMAGGAGSLLANFLNDIESREDADLEVLRLAKDIADLTKTAYGLDGIAVRFVDAIAGLHPLDCQGGALQDADVAATMSLPIDEMVDRISSMGEHSRNRSKKAYIISRRLELACDAFAVPPLTVVAARRRLGLYPEAEFTDAVKSLLSLCLGEVFGRWDIRYATGERHAPELPDPFAELPICPPGQLQNAQGLPASPADVPSSYPVKNIPWDGILVDDPNHPLDIDRRVREVIEIIWNGKDGGPTAEAIELEACEILGVKSLRDYFRKPANFFADHLKRYSKSRRQAPIYWPLSTKSGSYTLWIYYHRLNDQTLHKCLADFLDPKIKDVENELGKLAGKDSGRAADLRDFLNELKDLKDEIERVIKHPWKPNLNDGVLITASPLWKLFRLSKWHKDLKACWEELEKGDYDWSHLAYTIWPERVEKVCEKDRSIAIAQGLEHLCKIEPPKPKKPRGKKASS